MICLIHCFFLLRLSSLLTHKNKLRFYPCYISESHETVPEHFKEESYSYPLKGDNCRILSLVEVEEQLQVFGSLVLRPQYRQMLEYWPEQILSTQRHNPHLLSLILQLLGFLL